MSTSSILGNNLPISTLFDVVEELSKYFFNFGNFSTRGYSHAQPASAGDSQAEPVLENVVGLDLIGLGGSEAEQAIYIYAKSVPRAYMKQELEFKGYKTNFIRLGKNEVRPKVAFGHKTVGNCYKDSSGKIACGSSCAPSTQSYAGTFGAIAKYKDTETYFALSNNHVFAAGNHIEKGIPIMSPSNKDVIVAGPAPLAVFNHENIIELRSGIPSMVEPNKVDAAIAKVIDIQKITSKQGDFFDTPTQVTQPSSKMVVKKVGRTTGLTQGVVEAKLTNLVIPYALSKDFSATLYFKDVWTIKPKDPSTPFALPGDSGSLVVDEEEKNAIGLVFAAYTSTGYGLICPISTILDHFNIQLVNGI